MKTDSLADKLVHAWYAGSAWLYPLYPLAWLTALIASRRHRRFLQQDEKPPVPVIVVGNITVGGTGKTPVVVALCEAMKRRGIKVVVISRGYGGRGGSYPMQVSEDSDPLKVGDEPVLVARRTGVPVLIDPQRRRALDAAVADFSADVVISDDGMQHYALPRSCEIVVIDGSRGLGNGMCLPAGPLREPPSRLASCDWVVVNGAEREPFPDAVVMSLDSADPVNLSTGESMPIEDFVVRKPFCHAVAGIGNPERFFSGLEILGLRIERHPFPDHYPFSASDLAPIGQETVLMTEKDAVKCRALAGDDWWYLPVAARLPTVFTESVLDSVERRAG